MLIHQLNIHTKENHKFIQKYPKISFLEISENKQNIIKSVIDSLPNTKKILIEKTNNEKLTDKKENELDLMNEDKVILTDKDLKLK